MNTPSHVVYNLLALGRRDRAGIILPVVVGAFLPDLPIFMLYFVEKVIRNTPERVIWRETYFSDFWQNWIDVLHSFPLDLMGLGVTLWVKSQWGMLFFSSMFLHALADFPVHHDDGHRHFFPFSNWRFASPVSYWDPRHYGQIVAPIEIISVIVGCIYLARTYKSRGARIAIASLGILYAGVFTLATLFWLRSR